MDLTTFLHVILESGFAMFCILAAIHISIYDTASRMTGKVLTGGMLVNAVINIMDALAYFYRGDTSRTGYLMVRFSNFAVFAGMFTLIVLGAMLLDKLLYQRGKGSEKRLRNAVYAIAACGITALTASLPLGFLYRFDDLNYYHRGRAFVMIPALAFAAIVLMTARAVKEKDALSKREFRAFMCLYLLPALGTVLQTLFYGVSLSNIANSIALLIMLEVFIREVTSEVSVRRSFILSGEGIESISVDLDRFLEATGTERQNRIRIRFTVEDALYRIWKHEDDLTMVRVTASMPFGKPSIKIEHEGEAFNPFSKTKGGAEEWSSGLLASAGLSPAYSYTHGSNIIKIALGRMRINPVITILIAILFGLVAGGVASVALSASDAQFVTQGILVPVYDLWNNILYSVSAPAMFIIVMSTILDTREVEEQGGSAGLITGRYFVISLLLGLLTLAAGAVISKDAYSIVPFTRSTVSDLIQGLFSVVPENLLDPFKDFNTAQLILMGIIFAYATMAVGQQAGGIASFIHQLNIISAQLAQWIAGLMPAFTIFLTARLVLEKNSGLLMMLFSVLPFAVIVSLLVMAFTFVYIGKREGVSAALLLKKTWPSFAETLKSGQVSDTYALAENCCRKDLGIQRIFTERMMPLGLVLYMPVSMIGMISFVIYAAFRSGVSITPVWMLTAIVFALILLVAAPPIPGVNLLSYVVIIGQLGIGKEFIIAAMIFDIIFGMFGSAANQMMLQLDLVLQADHVGLLNHKALNSDN